jgi:hypothetical protein
MSGYLSAIQELYAAALCVYVYCGYSYINCSAVPNVRLTTSTVSVHGHSHAASMCEFPVKCHVAVSISGNSASSLLCAAFRLASNSLWFFASSAFTLTAAIESFSVAMLLVSLRGARVGTRTAADRNSSRRSSGFGRLSGKSMYMVAPRIVLVSTV